MIVNVISKSLVVLFILMVVMSVVFGASMAGAEFISPTTTAAKARQINVETDKQARINALELQKLEAQTQEEINQINLAILKEETAARLEMERLARLNELQAAFIENLYTLALILLGVVVLVFTFTLAYLLLRAGLARLPAAVAYPADPWKSADFRSQKRAEARDQEKEWRGIGGKNGHQKEAQSAPPPQNGSYKEAQPLTKR